MFELSVPNGAEREFGPQAWPNFWRIYWLSDGSGLIIAGQSESAVSSQMWQLSFPKAELQRLTIDVNHYIAASLSGDSRKLGSHS